MPIVEVVGVGNVDLPDGMSKDQMAAALNKLPKPVPEKGNMYTQGFEDIQYSPEGIPLNTSSYGSEAKGATKAAQQALTSTVGLPLNIATGVAKAPAGVVQALSKLMGSNAGDVPVNMINQIEKGTQAQMGGAGKFASQVGSVVGQTAPFLAGGTIGQIPSFTQKIGAGLRSGALSGLSTPEETGLSSNDFAEAKAKNIGIQTAFGGALPVLGAGVSKLVDAVRGTKLSPQMQNAVLTAREAGYTVPPTQAGGGIVNRALEGMAGKASTLQEASVRNQAITDNLAKKALGLPEDAILTPDLIKSIRTDAGKAYENLKLSGTIKTSPKFIQALDEIKPYQDAMQAAKDFPDELANPIIKTIDSLKRPNFDVNSAVSKINLLRNDADIAFRQGDTALAKANKEASQVLENTIENHLANTKQTDLLNNFRQARQTIAKTYEVEKAMNATTGTVNAQKLAARLQAKKPLSGELKQIAEFGQAFPKAAQTPERIGGTIGVSPLDFTVGGLTFGASLLGGEDKGSSGANAIAALLARPAARKAVLSNRMQNRLIQQSASAPSAIRQALPSSEEANQLAKILLMQSAGKAAQ
jgi:hypothetical protein